MAFESLESAQSVDDEAPGSGRLSQSGQLIGWAVYGSLMVVAFMFGIVTGYDQPKTITIAKLPKEKDNPKAESQKADTPKPNLKTNAEPNPPAQPIVTAPIVTTPKNTPVARVVNNSPKVEAKPTQPAVTTPPKPPTTIAAVPPKVETPPKKEDLKPVSFKTDVIPILRTHCLNCHGAAGKPRGDVDLTTLAKLMKSPSPDKILVPGKPEESDFYTSITQRDMPGGGKPKPSDKELLVLKNWILTGAKERRSLRGRNRQRARRGKSSPGAQ